MPVTEEFFDNPHLSELLKDPVIEGSYDRSVFSAYDAILPNVDDLDDPDTYNKRFKSLARKDLLYEIRLNEMARTMPGFFENYLNQFSNPLYYKEFSFPYADGAIHTDQYDANGEPYDWQNELGGDVIFCPIIDIQPFPLEQLATIVYVDGRAVEPSFYQLREQQVGYSLFLRRDCIEDNSKVSIEVRRFWNELFHLTNEVLEIANEYSFEVPQSSLGRVYHYDDGSAIPGDFLVFYKSSTERNYKILDRSKYLVTIGSENSENLKVSIRGISEVGTKYCVVNNSSGWLVERTTSNDVWEDSIPLICEENPSSRKIDPFTSESKIQRFPLSVEKAEDLFVVVYEQGDHLNFNLVPNNDYYIEESTNDEIPRKLVLRRKVAPNSIVLVLKTDPSTWLGMDYILETASGDGFISIADLEFPLDEKYVTVSINNKHIHRSELECPLNKVLRVKEADSRNLLHAQSRFVTNPAILRVLEIFKDYKPDLERYLELIEYNLNISAYRDQSLVPTSYEHIQSVSSDTWTVTHPLEKTPIVQVVLDDNKMIMPQEIEYVGTEQVIIRFTKAYAGKAVLQ
jgi:hypothetical protein